MHSVRRRTSLRRRTASEPFGPDDLEVLFPLNHPLVGHPVREIARAPRADLAVLKVEDHVANTAPVQAFRDYSIQHEVGEDFVAFGYPESVFGVNDREPVPRAFRGYFQRFFMYQSFAGYVYIAAEMSIPSPAGLSGGPVWRPHTSAVFGVVAENLRSTTTLEAVEEISRPDHTTRTEYQNVVNYGLVVMLHSLSHWLDDVLPAAT